MDYKQWHESAMESVRSKLDNFGRESPYQIAYSYLEILMK